jgi:hypothetical protein
MAPLAKLLLLSILATTALLVVGAANDDDHNHLDFDAADDEFDVEENAFSVRKKLVPATFAAGDWHVAEVGSLLHTDHTGCRQLVSATTRPTRVALTPAGVRLVTWTVPGAINWM